MVEKVRTRITGKSGRLGRVLVQTFTERGDEIVDAGPVNYLVFAHRYRGEPDYRKEMYANLEWIWEMIEAQEWEAGDRSITLVGSVSSKNPVPNQSIAYNLSKAALPQLARYCATTRTLRINVVSPSTFTGTSPEVSPQQVANVIAFLCSPQSSGITGQEIFVTGR